MIADKDQDSGSGTGSRVPGPWDWKVDGSSLERRRLIKSAIAAYPVQWTYTAEGVKRAWQDGSPREDQGQPGEKGRAEDGRQPPEGY